MKYIISYSEFNLLFSLTEFMPNNADLEFDSAIIDFQTYSITDEGGKIIDHFDCLTEEELLEVLPMKEPL